MDGSEVAELDASLFAEFGDFLFRRIRGSAADKDVGFLLDALLDTVFVSDACFCRRDFRGGADSTDGEAFRLSFGPGIQSKNILCQYPKQKRESDCLESLNSDVGHPEDVTQRVMASKTSCRVSTAFEIRIP